MLVIDTSLCGLHSTKKTFTEFRDFKSLEKNDNDIKFLFKLMQSLKGIESIVEVNFKLAQIIKCLMTTLDNYAPKRKIKISKKSWVTNEIIENMQKRDLLFENWVNFSNKNYHQQYKNQQNNVTNLIEKAKLNCFDTKIADPVSSKDLFRAYRLLSDRESFFQQSNISAETFNNYFTSVAANLAAKFGTDAYVKPNIETVLNTAFCSVVQTNEVVKVTKDLKINPLLVIMVFRTQFCN